MLVSIPDERLVQSSLVWLIRFGQHVAYDAQYLALAEELSAEFWSADHKLVNTLRLQDYQWAHWVGEIDSGG